MTDVFTSALTIAVAVDPDDVPTEAPIPSGSIPEWAVGKLVDLLSFIIGLLPDGPDSGSITSGYGSAMSEVVGHAATVGNWVPWGAFSTALTFVLAGLGFSFVVKITRIALSFITVGGGSAG